MAGLPKMFKGLCTPAQLYLVLSVLSIIIVFVVSINFIHLAISSAITIGWTYVLNKICQSGYNIVAWVLVLIPILGMLVAVVTLMLGMGVLATVIGEEVLAGTGVGEETEQTGKGRTGRFNLTMNKGGITITTPIGGLTVNKGGINMV